MKKLSVVLVLSLTAGLFLSGCSPKTTTSSSSSQTTQASKKKTKSTTTTKTNSQASTSTQTTQATTSQTQASTQQSTTQPNHAAQLAQLKQEEINWINEKENKANAIYNQQNNGSLNRLEAMNSQINSTKERCFTLIQQYM